MDDQGIETGRAFAAIAVILFALGVFLRIYRFWSPGLWIDEYGTWWMASYGGWGDTVRTTLKIQGDSPLTYLLARASIEAFGAGPFSLRLPSLIMGIAVLGLAYPVGRLMLGTRQAGLMALAVFAVNERLIYFSQEARPYVTALFGLMLSFYFYLLLLKKERMLYRLGYVAGAAVAVYAQYLFGFLLAVQAVHLFALRREDRRLKSWFLTFGALAALCLPGMLHLISLFGKREALDWIQTPSTFLAPLDLLLGLFDIKVLAVTALILLSGLIAAKISYEEQPQRRLGLVLTWLLLPVLFIAALPPLFGVSLVHSRYVLVALPALLLLIASALDVKARSRAWRWIPLLAFLALSFGWSLIPPLSRGGVFCAREDEPWAEAVASMEEDLRGDDLVLFWTGYVECDALASPDPDPEIVSFVSWPLEANFRRRHHNRMLGLPYNSETPETQARYRAALREAGRSPRTWFIGKGTFGQVAAQFVRMDPGLRLIRSSVFGNVYVGLIKRGH